MVDTIWVRIVDEEKIYGIKDRAFKRQIIDGITSKHGRAVAIVAQKKMSALLSPYNTRQRVGATGAASQNIFVKKQMGATKAGEAAWVVEEGDAGHNEYIRRGIKPGTHVPIAKLKEWAAAKPGFKVQSFYVPATEAIRGYTRKSKLGKTVNVRGYIRRLAGEPQKQRDDPYYRMASSIFRYGWARKPNAEINVVGSHMLKVFPKGQPRFDYVVLALKQSRYFSSETAKAAGLTAKAIVEYVLSGRKTGEGFKEFYAEEY